MERTFNNLLNSRCKDNVFVLCLTLEESFTVLPPEDKIIFITYDFKTIEISSFSCHFVKSYHHRWLLVLIKCFLYNYGNDHIIFIYFIYVLCHFLIYIYICVFIHIYIYIYIQQGGSIYIEPSYTLVYSGMNPTLFYAIVVSLHLICFIFICICVLWEY